MAHIKSPVYFLFTARGCGAKNDIFLVNDLTLSHPCGKMVVSRKGNDIKGLVQHGTSQTLLCILALKLATW